MCVCVGGVSGTGSKTKKLGICGGGGGGGSDANGAKSGGVFSSPAFVVRVGVEDPLSLSLSLSSWSSFSSSTFRLELAFCRCLLRANRLGRRGVDVLDGSARETGAGRSKHTNSSSSLVSW